ncbi:AbrB/MazE/SpoVT family DNA-binding domain-containing protein [Metabacillus niabensis]|uniref:AbrB/MazE/SpoVT family DNA-binding domain-containing protein n=1 Tax=Metabacillus niabensis TaxID=324854 RepID=UPI00399FCA4E
MKNIGIVRHVDTIGRIKLPKELRDKLKIGYKEPLEILTDNDRLVLRKYNPQSACVITGEISDQNKTFGNGKIVLSPKGIELLKNEFEEDSNRK